MLVDNVDQHFESCVLNARNAQKRAPNQINSLNTSKNKVMNIFRGFSVYMYDLWQNMKAWKCQKSTESFLTPIVNGYHY